MDAATQTINAVMAQLAAMDNPGGYEVGLRSEVKEGMLIRRWSAAEVENAIGFLRSKNAAGEHIYIRPRRDAPSALVLVDDWKAENLKRFEADGHKAACVIETSPGNLQAWIKLPDPVGPEVRKTIARWLVSTYGGDLGSADAEHFGRLSGFTNRKDKYRSAKGYFPFSKLVQGSGASVSEKIIELANACIAMPQPSNDALSAAVRAAAQSLPQKSRSGQVKTVCAKPLTPFKGGFGTIKKSSLLDGVDKGSDQALIDWYAKFWAHLADNFGTQFDASRADWMCACAALRKGFSPIDVETAMLVASPGLQAKRKAGHELDYLVRTVWKAAVWVDMQSQGFEWKDVHHILLDRARERRIEHDDQGQTDPTDICASFERAEPRQVG